LYSAAFAHTALNGAVVTDRAAIQSKPQQAKLAHSDFDIVLVCHLNGLHLKLKLKLYVA